MPRPKKPLAAALLEARHLHDRARFAGRAVALSEPLGEAPTWMSDTQRATWRQISLEAPWLRRADRCITEIAVIIRSRMVAGEQVGVSAMQLLRQTLAVMGMTPADACRVTMPDDEDADDDYFRRPQ